MARQFVRPPSLPGTLRDLDRRVAFQERGRTYMADRIVMRLNGYPHAVATSVAFRGGTVALRGGVLVVDLGLNLGTDGAARVALGLTLDGVYKAADTLDLSATASPRSGSVRWRWAHGLAPEYTARADGVVVSVTNLAGTVSCAEPVVYALPDLVEATPTGSPTWSA